MNETSELELNFKNWKAGSVSKSEYQTTNAVWVAHNLEEYAPRYYAGLKPELRDYCDNRLKGLRSREKPNAQLVGAYVCLVTRQVHENEANQRLLGWSLELLRQQNIVTPASQIERYLEKFGFNKLPEADVNLAIDTQRKDSRDAEFETRR